MHVRVHHDLKGPHGQWDVRCCGRDGEDIMKGLFPHVMGINRLHQVTTGNRHHGGVHGELQLPRTELWVGVHTWEPEPEHDSELGEKKVKFCIVLFVVFYILTTTKQKNRINYDCQSLSLHLVEFWNPNEKTWAPLSARLPSTSGTTKWRPPFGWSRENSI